MTKLKYIHIKQQTTTGTTLHIWKASVKWMRLSIIRYIDPTEWDIEVSTIDTSFSFASKMMVGDARKAFTVAERMLYNTARKLCSDMQKCMEILKEYEDA